jgi:hypothetical protein
MNDLIQATSVAVKTMADGTLRLSVDINPTEANKAFGLFGMPGAPLVLARLNTKAGIVQAQNETIIKGGFMSNWLAMRCKESDFHSFLDYKYYDNSGMVHNQEVAEETVKSLLGIESKKEVDNNIEAEEKFHRLIRLPYSEYLAGVR